MYAGSPFLCLRVMDLDTSRRFYEALGMDVVDEVPGIRTVLARGSFNLMLMPDLGETSLNFRGEDAFSIYDAFQHRGVAVEGKPERYKKGWYHADADGVCWATRDPDGNHVLFDTNENELGVEARRQRLARVLRNAEQDLMDAGASTECLTAYRTHVLDPFNSSE